METYPCTYVFFLAVLAQRSYAVYKYDVKCPKYSTTNSTAEDLKQYQGSWYNVYHSDNLPYTCAAGNVTITPNGTGFTEMDSYIVLLADGSTYNLNQAFYFPSGVFLGEYTIEDPNGEWITFIKVLAYDYSSYCISYTCNDTQSGTVETFSAATRSKIPSQTVKDKVKEVIAQYKITLNIESHPENCTLN